MNGIVISPGVFRLVLAGLVMISHMSSLEVGRIAVVLFFLLSGYWISDLWDRQSAGTGVAGFFANRFLRIWPLYAITIFAVGIIAGKPPGLFNWLLLGVASKTAPAIIGVEWSLDIEAQFYLLLPVAMYLSSRVPGLLMAVFAVVGVSVGWLAYDLAGYQTVFMYLPAFVAGMLLYRLPGVFTRYCSPAMSIAAFALLTLVLFALPVTRGMFSLHGVHMFHRDAFAMFWMLPLLPYIAASLAIRSNEMDRHIGNLAYPLYLIHYPVLKMVFELTGSDWPWKLAAALLAFVCALIIYIVIDTPLERFRRWGFSPKKPLVQQGS